MNLWLSIWLGQLFISSSLEWWTLIHLACGLSVSEVEEYYACIHVVVVQYTLSMFAVKVRVGGALAKKTCGDTTDILPGGALEESVL